MGGLQNAHMMFADDSCLKLWLFVGCAGTEPIQCTRGNACAMCDDVMCICMHFPAVNNISGMRP